MSIYEIILLGIALAMDAFAVSVCKGLALKEKNIKYPIIAGLYFGAFQALMPILGYFAGIQFYSIIEKVDHWIAFTLLGIIGVKMIMESFGQEESIDDSFGFKTMLILAIATSIDALAVGITFACLKVHIAFSAALIGIITFFISFAGVKIGNIFGTKLKNKAEIAGGCILVIIGVKILVEHLFFA
ncbi:MAG: manganese efflux pump MntP family protein [Lachnospiraceae bacterium]|nr:manganese efflux pump MntP family protein [Lachnospiraceae bacterium]